MHCTLSHLLMQLHGVFLRGKKRNPSLKKHKLKQDKNQTNNHAGMAMMTNGLKIMTMTMKDRHVMLFAAKELERFCFANLWRD